MSWKNIVVSLMIPALAVAACADDDKPVQNEPEVVEAPPEPVSDPPEEPAEPEPEEVCPHDGPPVIDPATLTACPSYVCGGGAHCVPWVLVPEEQSDLLAACNDDSACVPDAMIETMGNFLLEQCTAVLGLEGRCVSSCIPQVADRADSLTQETCGEFELCVPCFDPLSGEDTGVCNMTCDVGPSEPPPPALPTCCGDDSGTCVPKDVLPQEALDGLTEKTCDSDAMCVPNVMIDPTFEGQPCSPGPLLVALGIDDGACLPDCLDAVDAFGVTQSNCPNGYKCAPCNALGESTGACGDPW